VRALLPWCVLAYSRVRASDPGTLPASAGPDTAAGVNVFFAAVSPQLLISCGGGNLARASRCAATGLLHLAASGLQRAGKGALPCVVEHAAVASRASAWRHGVPLSTDSSSAFAVLVSRCELELAPALCNTLGDRARCHSVCVCKRVDKGWCSPTQLPAGVGSCVACLRPLH
jgi:hypothetical protein